MGRQIAGPAWDGARVLRVAQAFHAAAGWDGRPPPVPERT